MKKSRSSKEERADRIRKLLKDQKVLEEVKDSKTKEVVCAKGKKLTEAALESVKDDHLLKIKIDDADVKHKIDELTGEIHQYIKQLETRYHERIERVKKGDELSPGRQ